MNCKEIGYFKDFLWFGIFGMIIGILLSEKIAELFFFIIQLKVKRILSHVV